MPQVTAPPFYRVKTDFFGLKKIEFFPKKLGFFMALMAKMPKFSLVAGWNGKIIGLRRAETAKFVACGSRPVTMIHEEIHKNMRKVGGIFRLVNGSTSIEMVVKFSELKIRGFQVFSDWRRSAGVEKPQNCRKLWFKKPEIPGFLILKICPPFLLRSSRVPA